MCGRFTLDPNEPDVLDILDGINQDQHRLSMSTGEIYPTNIVPILVRNGESIEARPMIWGFPKWGGQSGVVFNARAETALEKPMFRKALMEHPAVVVTTGFYEWQAVPGQKKKIKYLFREHGQHMLYLAGCYNIFESRDGTGEKEEHFTILTTDANDSMQKYHNRMPVLLHPGEKEAWLKSERRSEFLERVPFEVDAIAV